LAAMLIGFSSYTPSAQACSCLPFGENFFETIAMHLEKVSSGEWPESLALNVVVVEVDRYIEASNLKPKSMIVSVMGSLQGNSCAQQIIVQGGDGASCEATVDGFKVGKRYILGLVQNNSGQYYVPLCGNYSKEMASGHIKK